MKQIFSALLFCYALAGFAQIPNSISPADKVYGLSRFWQEVNYNFAYFDKIDKEKWDNDYKQLIVEVQKTENDFQYYRLLQKFCASLKDGHTNVFFPQKKEFQMMNSMFGEYRLFFQNIGNKAIVIRTNLSKKTEVPIGSELIEVNGLSTNDYISHNVAPYISSSTSYVLQDESIATILKGLDGEKYQIKIKKPDNTIFSLSLTHSLCKEEEVFPAFEKDKELFEFKWLDGKIAYLGLNSFEDDKIDTLFKNKLPELYKAKSLIIDLRYNGGGDSKIAEEILKYFVKEKIILGGKSMTRENIATYKAWGAEITAKDTLTGLPNWGFTKEDTKKYFLMNSGDYYLEIEKTADTIKEKLKKLIVPTAILIGHNTASAAEDFLIMVDKQKHIKKIGSNSYGSTGQPFHFELPGGGSARICTKKVTFSDGREFIGYGIKPDIEVVPTLEDYLKQKDPVLEKAIEYLMEVSKKKIN